MEEEDEDHNLRPRKRRKKWEKERGQTTYTQVVRTMSGRRTPKVGVDDEGWQIADVSALEGGEVETGTRGIEAVRRQRERCNAGGVQCTDWTTLHDDSGYETRLNPEGDLEIPNSSSQLEVGPAQSTSDTFGTPKKARFAEGMEIPSSQSPASAKLFSSQKSQRFQIRERSPLKERSVNVPSPAGNYTASRQRKMQESPLKELHSPMSKSQARPFSSKSQRLQERLMEETRKVEMDVADNDKSVFPASLDGAALNVKSSLSAQRMLKRANTVQDSQFEDLDLDEQHALDTETDVNPSEGEEQRDDEEKAYEDGEGEGGDEEHYHDIQHTYDPAWSALERDAMRFCQTPTQAQTTQVKLEPHVSNSTTDLEEVSSVGDEEVQSQQVESVSQSLGLDLSAVSPGQIGARPKREVATLLQGPLRRRSRTYVSDSTRSDDDDELQDLDVEENDENNDDEEEDDLDVTVSAAPGRRSQELGSSDLSAAAAVPSSQFAEQQHKSHIHSNQRRHTSSLHDEPTSKEAMPAAKPNAANDSEVFSSPLPSSPPATALRPSQISTVAGTQLTPPRQPALQHHSQRQSPQRETPRRETSEQPASPPGPDLNPYTFTLTSSPLPQPPWSSSLECCDGFEISGGGVAGAGEPGVGGGEGRSGWEGRGDWEGEGSATLASLQDFSLPPPPSLRSSSG